LVLSSLFVDHPSFTSHFRASTPFQLIQPKTIAITGSSERGYSFGHLKW
jgi:hypothetical protein